MDQFAIVLYGAILVEAIVNIIQNVKEKEKSWKYWVSLAVAIGGGALVAWNWKVDIFAAVGFPEGQVPLVGYLLTGLILSRGGNIVSDIVGLINRGKV